MNRYVPTKHVVPGDVGIEGPDKIHAEGSSLLGLETLCGHDSPVYAGKWHSTTKPVTCWGCLDVISMAKRANTRSAA